MHGVLIYEKCCFSYFQGAGTARRWFCTTRRQAPDFWALGATIFLVREVRKTAFPGSLIV